DTRDHWARSTGEGEAICCLGQRARRCLGSRREHAPPHYSEVSLWRRDAMTTSVYLRPVASAAPALIVLPVSSADTDARAPSLAPEVIDGSTTFDDGNLEDGGADGDAPDLDASDAQRTCSDGGYCWTELPPDTKLRGVWSDGTGVAWAVSDEGKIM